MMDESDLKSCSYYLVRYVPHAEREEFVNIGLLLYSPVEQFLDCLVTRDFRRVRRLHPQADFEFLRNLQTYFELFYSTILKRQIHLHQSLGRIA